MFKPCQNNDIAFHVPHKFMLLAIDLTMYLSTAILLLICFRINSPFVLRLRPMKEIADLQKTKIIQPYPETFEGNPLERHPIEVQFQDKKPQCGPVPFPDFSCEVTTCGLKKVTQDPKIVPLHLGVDTTCDTLPTTTPTPTPTTTTKTTTTTTRATTKSTTTRPPTRKTVGTTKPKHVLHLKAPVHYKQYLQDKVKLTTMSTIPWGWDEDMPPDDSKDPVDLKACDDHAKCDKPKWD